MLAGNEHLPPCYQCRQHGKPGLQPPSINNKRIHCHHLYEFKVKVTQSCPNLCNRMDYTIHGILQARILEWVAIPFSRGSSQPRDQTQVSHVVGIFSPAEPPGKPKNTRVGGLSLLQGIFPTQELNQGLLHCRRILYQLSYQGSSLVWHQ